MSEEDERYSRRVHRSEEVNRPGFERYFEDGPVDAEAAEWDDEGYLVQPTGYITFGRYNYRMNESVTKFFGEEKCKKLVSAKGWYLGGWGWNPDHSRWTGLISKTEDGYPIEWYVLHEALSNLE